jgi:uncharacterized membrane protein
MTTVTHHTQLKMAARVSAVGLLACLQAGCDASGAPSFVFFGAYFPGWLLFALLWALLAVAVRVLMIAAGAGAGWPWPLPLALATGGLLALALWWALTGGPP